MLLNMLNDLAEAMKALDGKKGALERKTVIEKVGPELRDATIQAEYTQATAGETSDFRQMHRAQTSSSYCIICTLELRRGVIILIAVVAVIRIGTMRREGLQFVKSAVFHLRLLRLTMYFCFWTRTEDPILSYFQESAGDWICKVHCMLYNGTFTQVLFGDSVPHQRRTASSTSSIVILHAPRWY